MKKPSILTKSAATKGFGKAVQALSPLELARDYLEYRNIKEQEKTKREQIWAQRDVLVERFEVEREILISYLDRSFSERAHALNQFYVLLDQAVAERNDNLIDEALTSIVGIIKVSPFRGYAEFRAAFSLPPGSIEL